MVDTKKTTPQSTTPSGEDFVLKHRVLGAAVLLFFGALVLPYLLGPPSEASKTPVVQVALEDGNDLSSAEVEQQVLAELQDNSDLEVEQVYISKITPLDAARLEEERRRTEASKASKSSSAPLAIANVGEAKVSKETEKPSSDKTSEDKTVAPKPGAKKTETKTVASNKAQAKEPPQKKPSTKPQAKKPEPKKVAKTDNAKPAKSVREQELAAALAAESGDTKVDIGWVVQVGVFTDKKGAQKVVKDLTSKGFKPSTSIVDTNRGKKTGTRVWLGPFAQRVEAAKTKSRLTDRTGESGFIRAYP